MIRKNIGILIWFIYFLNLTWAIVADLLSHLWGNGLSAVSYFKTWTKLSTPAKFLHCVICWAAIIFALSFRSPMLCCPFLVGLHWKCSWRYISHEFCKFTKEGFSTPLNRVLFPLIEVVYRRVWKMSVPLGLDSIKSGHKLNLS